MRKSNDSQNELLSALLDDELTAEELASFSNAFANDKALRGQMARYQQISQALQQQTTPMVDASPITERVHNALLDEPVVLAPFQAKTRQRQMPSGVKRVALGAALAATVAVIAIGLMPQLSPLQQALQPQYAATPAPQATFANASTQQAWDTLQPAVRQQLGRYLAEHNEFAGQLSIAKRPNAQINIISIRYAD
jgi:negative regulator of sigma E activity